MIPSEIHNKMRDEYGDFFLEYQYIIHAGAEFPVFVLRFPKGITQPRSAGFNLRRELQPRWSIASYSYQTGDQTITQEIILESQNLGLLPDYYQK